MENSTNKEKKGNYVKMPWDDTKEIIFFEPDSNGETVKNSTTRWNLIQRTLDGNKPILDVEMLIDVIRSYNVFYNKDGKLVRPSWKCQVLRHYFTCMDDHERVEFFKKNGVLATIKSLALKLQEMLPKLVILKAGTTSFVHLHQMQIASILANAFLCTFPEREANCPSINFNTLYEGRDNGIRDACVEKIKCIVHYFKRLQAKQLIGRITFERLCIADHKLPRWDKTTANLCDLNVQTDGKIEDQDGFLQMDFANRYVGGGVLGRGCVQEEIRFIICPELIVSRLFTECLADNEALLIIGAERFCNYNGYSDTFEFAGDFQDSTPFDEHDRRKTWLIVIDALYFHHPLEQYRESKILRELKKAYVGFRPTSNEQDDPRPLATGNWGCGAYRGDPQLKSLLQLMASSQAQRNMLYLTFGDLSLKHQIDRLYEFLKQNEINVGMLYKIIRRFNKEKRKDETLFEFIRESINCLNENAAKFSRRRNKEASAPVREEEDEFSALEKAATCKIRNEIHFKKVKTLEKRQPEENVEADPGQLEKKMKSEKKEDFVSDRERKWLQICSSRSSERKAKSEKTEDLISDQERQLLQIHSSNSLETEKKETFISDQDREFLRIYSSNSLENPEPTKMWFESEKTNRTEQKESVCLATDDFEEKNLIEKEEENPRNSKENEEKKKVVKKFSQPKITDCFFKKS